MAIALTQVLNVQGTDTRDHASGAVSIPVLPSLADMERAVSQFVLPQLSLTFTNAVLLTALVAGGYFGDCASHATPASLSVTSGIANLLLTPLGALPMCHGAGDTAPHYRMVPTAAPRHLYWM